MRPIYILSGNPDQARQMATMLGLMSYNFVHDETVLQGLDRGTTIWAYGDYQFRKDWKGLRTAIRTRGFRVMQISRKDKL